MKNVLLYKNVFNIVVSDFSIKTYYKVVMDWTEECLYY